MHRNQARRDVPLDRALFLINEEIMQGGAKPR
jgi:hypothetical protein